MAALQFAHASGAIVVSTTSSEEKHARLNALGASHTKNYRVDAKRGEKAKLFTQKQVGISNVIDVRVGGLSTLSESLKAVNAQGVVTLTGVLGDGEAPSMMDTLWRVCSVGGAILESKRQFKDMVRFVKKHDIKPVMDDRVFGIDEVREAFAWIKAQKHFSKVVVKFI